MDAPFAHVNLLPLHIHGLPRLQLGHCVNELVETVARMRCHMMYHKVLRTKRSFERLENASHEYK